MREASAHLSHDRGKQEEEGAEREESKEECEEMLHLKVSQELKILIASRGDCYMCVGRRARRKTSLNTHSFLQFLNFVSNACVITYIQKNYTKYGG